MRRSPFKRCTLHGPEEFRAISRPWSEGSALSRPRHERGLSAQPRRRGVVLGDRCSATEGQERTLCPSRGTKRCWPAEYYSAGGRKCPRLRTRRQGRRFLLGGWRRRSNGDWPTYVHAHAQRVLEGARALVAGANFTCALKGDEAWCWGIGAPGSGKMNHDTPPRVAVP